MMSQTRPQGVCAVLQDKGAPIWAEATGHPMVQEIGQGTLPREKFRYYFEQNILYLLEYARAISLIAGKAPDEGALRTLGRFARQIVEKEIPENRQFLERLGGDPWSIDTIATMAPTTYDYTRHLLHVAAQGSCAEGLTAVLPCQWSYGSLARPLMEQPPEDPIYRDWIRMFGNEEYDGLVGETMGLLDRLADPSDSESMRVLSWIFDASTRYEVLFWDMAYKS